MLLIPSVLFQSVERKFECAKMHDPLEMVAEFYASTNFLGAFKGMTPAKFAPAHHSPVINDWYLTFAEWLFFHIKKLFLLAGYL